MRSARQLAGARSRTRLQRDRARLVHLPCALNVQSARTLLARLVRVGRARLAPLGRWHEAREFDGERRALADLGVDGDLAAVARHQLVHDREAEARALADIFGREERVPDA